MNRIFLLTLVVAVVIIGGFLVLKGGGGPNDAAVLSIVDGKITGEYAMKDIIALDESFKCEFEKADGDSEVRGTVSIAPGNKVRGDFNITSSATPEPFETHFIMRAGYIYTWTSLLDKGFIAPVKPGDNSGQAGVVTLDEKINYDCSRFTPAPGIFEVPADITFSNAR